MKIAICSRKQCKHKHPLQSDVIEQYMNDGKVRSVNLHLMRFIPVVELPVYTLNFFDTIDISVVKVSFIASHNMRLGERQSRRWLAIFNSQNRYLHPDQKFPKGNNSSSVHRSKHSQAMKPPNFILY